MNHYTIIQDKTEITLPFKNKTDLRHWIINHLLIDKPIEILKIYDSNSIVKQTRS